MPATNGLSDLPVGNGGQVVRLPSLTPLSVGNFTIDGRVVYSWPQHNLEPIQAGNAGAGAQAGDSGSMDSPFDFKLKMVHQLGLLSDWYNSQGKKFVKPRSQWPASTLDGFETLVQFVTANFTPF